MEDKIYGVLAKYGIDEPKASAITDDLLFLCAVVGRSEKFICPCCGSDKTYKTEAYHCNRCAVNTEI